MKYIRVPSKITIKGHTYKYIEQVNDNLYLYEEVNLGYKECFLTADLVQIREQKSTKKGIPSMER